MSTLIATNSASIAASFVAEALPFPFPEGLPDTELCMDFADFGCKLVASITDLQLTRESDAVNLRANFDNEAIIELTFSGGLCNDFFRIDEISIEIEAVDSGPRAEFTATTLDALIGLSHESALRIPAIGLDIRQSFDVSLKRVSQSLRNRETAYRLMAIEAATGLKFLIPQTYSRDDADTISYIYHAIVDQSFVWPIGAQPGWIPATQEHLARFPLDEIPTRQALETRVVKTLFGQVIEIGDVELLIDDAVFENVAAVRSELASNDGHRVEATLRSLSDTGRVVAKNAPRLPEVVWDSSIQALIDVGPGLDACLAERLSALAASTLADLTEYEKREVTARADLDVEAFR